MAPEIRNEKNKPVTVVKPSDSANDCLGYMCFLTQTMMPMTPVSQHLTIVDIKFNEVKCTTSVHNI